MRRFLLAPVLAVAFAALSYAVPAPAAAVASADLAPADRYFGRLKMSILGVRNALKDLSERADARPEEHDHVYDKAVLVEDALRDWQKQFPRDPWIPRYAFSLAQLYGKLAMDDARVRKNDTLDWLVATYPASSYAQQAR